MERNAARDHLSQRFRFGSKEFVAAMVAIPLLVSLSLSLFQPVGAQQEFPLATPESQGVDPQVLKRIKETIQGFVDGGEIVGAELLVIRNRKKVFHEGFGWRHREEAIPMEPGTVFNLRSMAKPIVGSIAQRMVDAGRVDVDARAADFLPAFAGGLSSSISIAHLLTHTSGLPDGNPAGRPSDYPTLRSVADYWGEHGPTAFPPGEGFLYSDPGADVLAVILQETSGKSLPDLAREEVFGPLGMVDSHAFVDRLTSADPRFAADYAYSEEQGAWLRYWKPGDGSMAPFPIGSGTTWYATAEDYARFLEAWMDAVRAFPGSGIGPSEPWLSANAARSALTPVSPMPYPSRLPDLEVRYGQMWIVYVNEGGERVAFGHSGSDGTYAYAWPQEDLMVLYMTQSRGNRTRLLLEPLFGRLLAGDGASGQLARLN